jgi:hypothetical protein
MDRTIRSVSGQGIRVGDEVLTSIVAKGVENLDKMRIYRFPFRSGPTLAWSPANLV